MTGLQLQLNSYSTLASISTYALLSGYCMYNLYRLAKKFESKKEILKKINSLDDPSSIIDTDKKLKDLLEKGVTDKEQYIILDGKAQSMNAMAEGSS